MIIPTLLDSCMSQYENFLDFCGWFIIEGNSYDLEARRN